MNRSAVLFDRSRSQRQSHGSVDARVRQTVLLRVRTGRHRSLRSRAPVHKSRLAVGQKTNIQHRGRKHVRRIRYRLQHR